MSYNIVQVGSFDVENYGDLLFPVIFEYEIKKRIALNHIFLFSPNGGTMPFSQKKVFPLSTLDNFCQNNKVDCIVVGGGDIVRVDKKVLRDYHNSFIPSISMWQLPIIIANKYRIPVILNCPGVPFKMKHYTDIVSSTLKESSYISVRDPESKRNLGDSNLDVKVIIDSVSIINNVFPKKELYNQYLKLKNTYDLEEKYIVIQINYATSDSKSIKNIESLIKVINEKYEMQVVFCPIGYVHSDQKAIAKIKSLNKKNIIIKEKMSPKTMLSLFSHSSGFIGTSLHGLITSSAYHVPILAINKDKYLSKISGFMELCNIQQREITNLNNLIKIFEEQFFNKIDYDAFSKEQKKLSNHFDKISNIIKNKTLAGDNTLEILASFYQAIDRPLPKEILQKCEKYDKITNYDYYSADEIIQKCKQYDDITNSGLWKTSQPIRKILSKLKES